MVRLHFFCLQDLKAAGIAVVLLFAPNFNILLNDIVVYMDFTIFSLKENT